MQSPIENTHWYLVSNPHVPYDYIQAISPAATIYPCILIKNLAICNPSKTNPSDNHIAHFCPPTVLAFPPLKPFLVEFATLASTPRNINPSKSVFQFQVN